jgi:localization factor PodJL
MSKSTAWGPASVSPNARRLAEQAASRAGVTLEEWLDRAIADHADEGPRARQEPPMFRAEGASARDLQERLRASAGTVERRATPGGQPNARALSSFELIDSARVGQGWLRPNASSATPVRKTEDTYASSVGSEPRLRGMDPGSAASAPRTGDAHEPFAETGAFAKQVSAPGAFDLESAVSQIASRRRALDARLAHDGLVSPPRNVGSLLVEDQEESRARPVEAGPGVQTSPSDPMQVGLHALSEKLEALQSEWSAGRTSDQDLESLQNQMADVRRKLSDLAPRKTVGDRIADELRAALSVYDPKGVAAELERRIEFVGTRIDALADAIVRPEVVETVRRQMQEVHDLLLAAAQRSIPIERIEGQISRLVDRVERLTANPSNGLATEPMTELLAALQRPPALASFERRLEALTGRLEHEVQAWSQARPKLQEFDTTLRQIAPALQQSLGAAPRLAASVNALNARLESASGEPLVALISDLSARFDAAELRERERAPIEPILSEIVERLDRLPGLDGGRDVGALRSIDDELKSLRATLEGGAAPAFTRLAEEVAQRLEGYFAPQTAGAAISDQFGELNRRLDAISDRLGEAGALERAARDLIEKLRDGDKRSESVKVNTEVAERLSVFRQERAEADRRTETLLQSMQDLLDRMVDRLSADDAGPPLRASMNLEDGGRSFAEQGFRSARVAGLGDIAPRPPKTSHEPAAGGYRAARSDELDDEFLLEPGAGAPQHLQVAADHAETTGSRTHPSISAHIAAARRAAQSAVAETNEAKTSTAWPRVEESVQHARRFYARHKRSLLLAAALVLAVTALARLMDAQAPLPQKSELDAPTPKAAAPSAIVGPSGMPPASVDAAPIGSIGQRPPGSDNSSGSAPPPPDLAAAIPSGATPSLREAVLAGSPAAQYDLAQRLLEGRGLSQNQAAGAYWLDRAASAGFAPAEFRLGALYQKGVGVPRDPAAAKRWYTAAARAGNARAAHNLGVMDAEPTGEKADYADAAKWFRKAAEMGVRDSQFNLAVLYARGLGVEQDLGQSWIWFSLAAAQGDSEAARKRDEVAAKMGPDALTAATDQLAKFKTIEPDPAANDISATPRSAADKIPASPAAPTPSSSRIDGSGS